LVLLALIPFWLLAVVLVSAICRAAQAGDRAASSGVVGVDRFARPTAAAIAARQRLERARSPLVQVDATLARLERDGADDGAADAALARHELLAERSREGVKHVSRVSRAA
jgi:hypothetical protein